MLRGERPVGLAAARSTQPGHPGRHGAGRAGLGSGPGGQAPRLRHGRKGARESKPPCSLTARPSRRGLRSPGPARPKQAPVIRAAGGGGRARGQGRAGRRAFLPAGREGACPGRNGARGRPAPRLRQSGRARPPYLPASLQGEGRAHPLSNYGMHLSERGHRLS
jgi:hypothetical protein